MKCVRTTDIHSYYIWGGATDDFIVAEAVPYKNDVYDGYFRGSKEPHSLQYLVKIGMYIMFYHDSEAPLCAITEETFNKYYTKIGDVR